MDEGGGGMENIALNVCVNSNNKDGAWKQVFKKSKQNKVMTTGNANVAEDQVASCSSGNRENENINNDECAVRNSVAKMTRSREEDDTMGYKRRRVNDDSVRYTAEHTGEINVLVDTSEAENVKNKRVKNGLYFVEKIKGIKSDEFSKIKKIDAIGVTLYKVSFEDIDSANKFVGNEELRNRKLRAFIPRNFIETFGVIRDVPLGWTEDEILNGLVSSRKVASVKRFSRRDESNTGVFHPTETVKVGFLGDEHPPWVIFERAVLVVNTYYPAVRQCHKCGRLGHTRMGCRSQKRCIKCGKDESGCDGQCNVRRCILCNSDEHIANDKEKCPKWIKEIETNKIMTKKKLSKREVLQGYRAQNRFDILWDDSIFPGLYSGRDTKKRVVDDNTLTKDQEVNNMLTPFTYNSVAKKPKKPYVHSPGVQMQSRMYEEASPSRPVFMKDDLRVSELEKITAELFKFVHDLVKMSGNSAVLDAMNHFSNRIQKCGVKAPSSVGNVSSLHNDHENMSI